MSLARYVALVLMVALASLALVWAIAGGVLGPSRLRAAALGAGIAVANTLAAFALVVWSSRGSTNRFLAAVLGGMVGRMALMLAAVAAAILWLGMPGVPLAVSLLSYFTLFLIVELRVLHRWTSRPRPKGAS